MRQIALEFREGTSDKVYEVDLCEVGPDQYVVNFRFGRRLARLQEGTKTDVPVGLAQATRAYERLVAEKTGKGYRERGASPPPPEPDPAEAPRVEDVADPRAARLLAILSGRERGWTRDQDRLAWRVGELRVREAVPYLLPMLTGSTDRRAFVVARALLRCGDPAAIPHLFHLWESRKGSARSMAAHALATILDGADRATFLGRLRDLLPPAIPTALDAERYDALSEDLADSPEWLDLLYLTAEGDRRAKLLRLLAAVELASPLWKGVRRVFKAAEARADADVFGLLARRFDEEAGVNVRRRRQASVSYSSATRRWFRRRVWRTLRRLGEARQTAEYTALASGVLLALDDAAAQPASARQQYDWAARRTETIYGSPWRRYWTFGHVLWQHSERYEAKPRYLTISLRPRVRPDAPEPAEREEAFPEAWDAHPEALADLLDRSRCQPVHAFATKALRANRDAWHRIPVRVLVGWFASPYAATAELAAEVALTRYDPKDPDLDLVLALLSCAHEGARRTADGWVRANPVRFLADERFLVGIVLNPVVGTRRLALELLGSASLLPAHAKAVVDAVLTAATRTDPADEPATERVRDAGAVLLAAFSKELSELPLERVAELVRHPAQGVSELGARILLGHRVRPAELPDDLLAAAMTSVHPAVRGIGIRLYGELPDAVLAERFRVLVHLVTNPHADVRAAVWPIVARLTRSPAFTRPLLSVLVPILAAEGPNGLAASQGSAGGMHADVVRLLRTELRHVLPYVDAGQVFRLLRASETVVQELGGDLLRTNVDPRATTTAQLAILASSDVLGVRRTAWAMLEHRVEELRARPEDLLPLLDARWEDSRAFAFLFVEEKLGPEALSPEVAMAVCDSVRPDVQAFGRKLVPRLFAQGDGPRWLLRLAQHPAPAMQAYAATWLEQHAHRDPERLARLQPFLVGVLARPNVGKAAKARVLAFVEGQLDDPACAAVLAPVLSELVLTAAKTHRERYVAMLTELRARHPQLETPLRVIDPEVRGAV